MQEQCDYSKVTFFLKKTSLQSYTAKNGQFTPDEAASIYIIVSFLFKNKFIFICNLNLNIYLAI